MENFLNILDNKLKQLTPLILVNIKGTNGNIVEFLVSYGGHELPEVGKAIALFLVNKYNAELWHGRLVVFPSQRLTPSNIKYGINKFKDVNALKNFIINL